MSVFHRNEVDMFYELDGEGSDLIVLINGHTRSSRDFIIFARKLRHAGLQTLIFDNRGCGQTRNRKRDFTLVDMADDVIALLDHLGIQSAHMLGISMGGMIAQIIASSYPGRLQKLCLVSTSPNSEYLTDAARVPWGRTFAEVRAKLERYFTDHFVLANRSLIDAMARQTLNTVVNDDFLEDAEEQRKAMAAAEGVFYAASIACPTLIIHGEDDMIISQKGAYALHKAIEGSELVIAPSVGHLLLAEANALLLRELLQFLNVVPQGQ